MNATSYLSAGTGNGPQEVTGPQILWALIALGLTAMTQRSITADYVQLPHDIFNQSLFPLRTSPFICITDTLFEATDILMKLATLFRHGDSPSDRPYKTQESRQNRAIYVLQIFLFGLGALPQALKLMVFQGVEMSRALSIVYLVAIAIHSIHCLVCDDKLLSSSLKCESERHVRFLLGLFHVISYAFIWCKIHDIVWILVSKVDLGNAAREVIAATNIILLFSLPFLILSLAVLIPLIPRHRFITIHWLAILHIGIRITWNLSLSREQPKERSAVLDDGWWTRSNLALSKTLVFHTVFNAGIAMGPPMVLSMLLAISFNTVTAWLTCGLVTHRPDDMSSTERASHSEDVTKDHVSASHDPPDRVMLRSNTWDEWRTHRSWLGYGVEAAFYAISAIIYIMSPAELMIGLTDYLSTFKAEIYYTTLLIFNIMTVSTWYFVVFDGTDTVNPGWTGVFG